ncbi:MAG: hypothetical protein JXJ20_09575 [Anaerolineae bacterium]|jgi:NAD/NADP transhydrogenase alpha subunit|nr:hypothetical protein [Anaerolineae bacterium]
MQTAGYFFLALFAVTLFVLYIAIRRTWGQTLYLSSMGAIISVASVILYALTYEKTSTAQAIFAGLVVGLGFTAVVVIIALFFRTNQPSAEIKLASQQPEKGSFDGERNHAETPE